MIYFAYGDAVSNGEITDISVSTVFSKKVEVTVQNFGNETKHIYRLDNPDGARWFLDSLVNDRNLRMEMGKKAIRPIEIAMGTLSGTTIGKSSIKKLFEQVYGLYQNTRYEKKVCAAAEPLLGPKETWAKKILNQIDTGINRREESLHIK